MVKIFGFKLFKNKVVEVKPGLYCVKYFALTHWRYYKRYIKTNENGEEQWERFEFSDKKMAENYASVLTIKTQPASAINCFLFLALMYFLIFLFYFLY